jgi:hypothetical protein
LLEPRLQARYRQLVREHLGCSLPLAAGLRALPGGPQAFASTQAAWRFFANPAVTLPQLAQPLLDAARAGVATHAGEYALVVHDWSALHYEGHGGKRGCLRLPRARGRGYELRTALVLSDATGQPLAPAYLGLRAAEGIYETTAAAARPAGSRLDELAGTMAAVARLGWDKPAVHLIDREGDSVGHYRQWHRAGHRFLVRANAARWVTAGGRRRRLAEVVADLHAAAAFRPRGAVEYRGQSRPWFVAECAVTLHRPAKPQRRGQARRRVPGPPLPLRLVVSEVRAAGGAVLARWLLLTNLPPAVPAPRAAVWYYWRWRVESYFKLLKGAGQQVERWQQRTPAAVARRLAVAGMACVLAWQLARSPDPAAADLSRVLVRLSGRATKRSRPITEPALLAGLWTLLGMIELAHHHDLPALQRQLGLIFPAPRPRPPPGRNDPVA